MKYIKSLNAKQSLKLIEFIPQHGAFKHLNIKLDKQDVYNIKI